MDIKGQKDMDSLLFLWTRSLELKIKINLRIRPNSIFFILRVRRIHECNNGIYSNSASACFWMTLFTILLEPKVTAVQPTCDPLAIASFLVRNADRIASCRMGSATVYHSKERQWFPMLSLTIRPQFAIECLRRSDQINRGGLLWGRNG